MEVVHYKSKVLYTTAKEVSSDQLGEKLDNFMSEMATVMYSRQGVGLGGPQVGSDLRILVADIGYVNGGEYGRELVKMVNPIITHFSESTAKLEEQCISYSLLKVAVDRPEEITVKYLTPLGEPKESTYSGWQARVISHEMDHLDGVTLYSRLGSLGKKRYDEMLKKKSPLI